MTAPVVDLSDVRWAFKPQSGLYTPASGANAHGVELLNSSGISATAATIASGMNKRNKMKRRSMRGSVRSTASYETEIIPGCFEGIGPCVLGADDWTPEALFDETTFGQISVTDAGETLTAQMGDFIDEGFVAGQFIWIEGFSVGGNTGKWVPIKSVGGANNRVLKIPPGYLANDANNAAYDIVVARHVLTPEEYIKTYVTAGAYLGNDVPLTKGMADALFNSLVFSDSPTNFPKFAFGLGGRKMSMDAGETFTDPVFPQGRSLTLHHGGLFLKGVKRVNLTSLTFGITAPISATDYIGNFDGAPSRIGDFEFNGSFGGTVADDDDFADFDQDEDIDLLAHYKRKASERGVGIYSGNLGYGGYGSPEGGQGDQISNIPLYGGDDDRGDGCATTTFLLSDLTEFPISLAS